MYMYVIGITEMNARIVQPRWSIDYAQGICQIVTHTMKPQPTWVGNPGGSERHFLPALPDRVCRGSDDHI